MASSVRVEVKLAATLRALAKAEHRPIGRVIDDAVAPYTREKFWRDVEALVERLGADPVAWKEYRNKLTLLEGGSKGGLKDQEPYCAVDNIGDS